MIKGCDISKHQGQVNWDALKASLDFVIMRSSYGTGYKDEQFDRNRDESRRVGILRGFYHYAYPTYNTPEAEAEWFSNVVGTPQSGEVLVLDFEEAYPYPVDWSKRFLDKLSALYSGYKPMIYINLNLNNTQNWASVVNGNYGLWLAKWDYNPDAAKPTTDWPFIAMRQYSNKGNVAGISPLDLDVFYGDGNTFQKYGYKPTPPAPVPVPDPTPIPVPEPTPEPIPPVIEPPVIIPPLVEPAPPVVPINGTTTEPQPKGDMWSALVKIWQAVVIALKKFFQDKELK